jgi:hypothetical protein
MAIVGARGTPKKGQNKKMTMDMTMDTLRADYEEEKERRRVNAVTMQQINEHLVVVYEVVNRLSKYVHTIALSAIAGEQYACFQKRNACHQSYSVLLWIRFAFPPQGCRCRHRYTTPVRIFPSTGMYYNVLHFPRGGADVYIISTIMTCIGAQIR